MAWRRAGGPPTVAERPRPSTRDLGPDDGSNPDIDGTAGTIWGRRYGRPGSRAVIGGVLVAAAAVIVFVAAISAAGSGRAAYAVANRPLAAGSVIGPGDLRTVRLGLSGATAGGAWRDPSPLIGRTLRISVDPGELIQTSMLAPGSGSDLRPVSIPVDTDSLAGLAVGQSVDVLETASSSSSGTTGSAAGGAAASGGASGEAAAAGAGEDSGVTVVLRGAALWSIGHTGSGLLSGAGNGTVVVTLGVTDLSDAEALIAAAHSGTVELVQAEPADGRGPGPGASSS